MHRIMDILCRAHKAGEDTQRSCGMGGTRAWVVGLFACRVRVCTVERRIASFGLDPDLGFEEEDEAGWMRGRSRRVREGRILGGGFD